MSAANTVAAREQRLYDALVWYLARTGFQWGRSVDELLDELEKKT